MVHAGRMDSPGGEEAVLSTVSTALGVLCDIAGALQTIPYAGAIAIVAVKVLEIREELKDNEHLFKEVKEKVAGRTLRLVEALQSQANLSSHPTLPSPELLRDLERYER
jgi:predicted regulator of amino acid metabolism with ACT domain